MTHWRWKSNAQWPEGVGYENKYGEPVSSDTHYSEREARAVCNALEREGFGGEGRFFPVKTWVSEYCIKEKSGWCESSEPCQYKVECEDGSFICEDKL